MHLNRLRADGVRNLSGVAIEPHRRLTLFLGDNGQGKTNLLEAVHLCAALRPLKPLERARDLVGFGRESGRVEGQFDLDGPLPVEVVVEPRGRKATLAGKRVRDVGQLASRIGVVAFVPEELALVRGGPDLRRRAIDRFAFGLDPGFLAVARRYEAALDRRNRLLKERFVDPSLLDAYTAPLVDSAVELVLRRHAAVARWAPPARELTSAIADGALDVRLSYQCSFADGLAADPEDDGAPDAGRLRAALLEKLERTADGERTRRTTLAGPHLDELAVALGTRRARHLASQGEARAIVLALKLAAVRVYTEVRGAAPLLLLDDVAGELDPHKAACLFAVVDEVGAQTFVTATHLGALPAPGIGRAFFLRKGEVTSARDLA